MKLLDENRQAAIGQFQLWIPVCQVLDGSYASRKNVVNDPGNRHCRVNFDRVAGNVRTRFVQSHNHRSLRRSPAPFTWWSVAETLMQGVPIDLENEYLVKQINETPEVAGAATEEGDGLTLVARNVPNLRDVPNMMLVRDAIKRFAGTRIALVR